jgi:hypothetical protein
MRLRLPKRNIITIGFFVVFAFTSNAQALFDVGIKGGTTFYLGDINSTLFNKFQPIGGAYFRYNINSRWATKLQGTLGKITDPMNQKFMDISLQQEFNFFEYGLLKTGDFEYTFSPYICVGIGLTSFINNDNDAIFSPNIPFGVGIKYKVLNRINIGLEWTMHKLFTDNFDGVDNPYQIEKSSLMNNDWYSMCTLSIGIDLGERYKFCK